jgi:triosephosphate isomerase
MKARLGKLYLGTNLKMYKTIRETLAYLQTLAELTADLSRSGLELFVIPSYLSLPAATERIDQERIRLGAQNMHWEDRGQFTGEVSPPMLAEIGVRIVEIGHSERRQHFHETDAEENLKVKAALKHGFTPLLCVGETGAEKELGISDERLRQQIKAGLRGVAEADAARIWVAYEPVWAIGVNGTPAGAGYASQKQGVIRETLTELFPGQGGIIPILYGGSVNPRNATELIAQPWIDGLFIGRSAWDAADFNQLIRKVLPVWAEKVKG